MDLFGRVAISWSEVGANGRSRGRGGGGGCGGGGGGGSGGGEPRTLEEVSTTTGPSAGPKTGPPVQGREEERHPEGEAEVGLAAVSATALKPQGRGPIVALIRPAFAPLTHWATFTINLRLFLFV
ncbi:hypothetical protein HZH66_005047 [Vespula vulgaris]|uniref:Uncharacterized protein n=1 Tax=Vespula vulgaris TaxID=7454 RepID=A0A834NAH6_VESVU|nr:hypothetical protein HZH66_005047 [Vespula vulgaris]